MKSVYIHIPFCSNICTYCDFTKNFYNEEMAFKYLVALENEVNSLYENDMIKTIYIGGGTPSVLNMDQLEQLFSIVKKFKLTDDYEFTFECNVLDTNIDKLNYLFNNGVNRLSIGMQTANEDYLKFLGRDHKKSDVVDLISNAKKVGFKNISVDLMYGLPNQTIKELTDDLDFVLNLGINHVSTYSLIIEEHTKLFIDGIKNIDEDLEFEMYTLINDKLKDFEHYEISNFGLESKHNLVYWNNLEYYGFGCGASGYLNDHRYDNTKSISNYIKGTTKINDEYLDLDKKLENEFILGFRKIKGINKKDFYEKYGYDICDIMLIKELILSNELIDDETNVFINPKYIYVSNNILLKFVG